MFAGMSRRAPSPPLTCSSSASASLTGSAVLHLRGRDGADQRQHRPDHRHEALNLNLPGLNAPGLLGNGQQGATSALGGLLNTATGLLGNLGL